MPNWCCQRISIPIVSIDNLDLFISLFISILFNCYRPTNAPTTAAVVKPNTQAQIIGVVSNLFQNND
jgi:hypothetical protein